MRERVTVDGVQRDHLSDNEQRKVRDMLHEFEDMRQGKLGTVKVTEPQMVLEPESRSVRLPPHRAGHKARQV